MDRFLPPVNAFGVDVERPGGGVGRAALRGQAQGFDAEGRIVRAAIVGFRGVFHDEGEIPTLFCPDLVDHLMISATT